MVNFHQDTIDLIGSFSDAAKDLGEKFLIQLRLHQVRLRQAPLRQARLRQARLHSKRYNESCNEMILKTYDPVFIQNPKDSL